jgi:hypothetical protein
MCVRGIVLYALCMCVRSIELYVLTHKQRVQFDNPNTQKQRVHDCSLFVSMAVLSIRHCVYRGELDTPNTHTQRVQLDTPNTHKQRVQLDTPNTHKQRVKLDTSNTHKQLVQRVNRIRLPIPEGEEP